MINLIPIEEKKALQKELYIRIVSFFCFVSALAVLFFCVVLIPAYFLSSVKIKLVQEKIQAQEREPVPAVNQATMQVISDLNMKISLIENAEKNKFSVSDQVIKEIILKKMSDIKINKISYLAEMNKSKSISIRGTAPDRERLLLFRRALEDDATFTKVDLPISNFVKGSNIQFFLTLQLK